MRIYERNIHDHREYCHNLQFESGNSLSYLNSGSEPPKSTATSLESLKRVFRRVQQIFYATFLPAGYPHSVRPEYVTYQLWDGLQGVCSYVRGVLTTRSVLSGIGVGSSEASAVSAALIWAMRDGMGMIASLTVAYHFSDLFEVNFKEWRLMADILNNIGLTFDLMASVYPKYYLYIAAISAVCHSCCGLIAGSTKARISAHFALNGQIADITAKESTQETAVALIGLVVGMICTHIVDTDVYSTWTVFLLLLVLHVYSNYQLMRSLVVRVLNPQRLSIMTRILSQRSDPSDAITPDIVAKQESLGKLLQLSRFGPRIGQSIRDLVPVLQTSSLRYEDLHRIFSQLNHGQMEYIIGYDRYGRSMVILHENCSERSIVKAFVLALFIDELWTRRKKAIKCMECGAISSQKSFTSNPISQRLDWLVRSHKCCDVGSVDVPSDIETATKWFDHLFPGANPTQSNDSMSSHNSHIETMMKWGWDISQRNAASLGVGHWRLVDDSSSDDSPNKKHE